MPFSTRIRLLAGPAASVRGFTLVEIIIAAVLLAIVGSSTAIALLSANRSVVRNELLARTSSSIDSNVSQILRLAEQYTCCSGVCTSDAAAIAAAGAKCTGTFGDANYYFPSVAVSDQADLTNFLTRCKPTNATNGLVAQLITEINSNVPAPSGVSRTIEADPDAPLEVHRIRATFSGNGFTRVVKVVPTVAVWCP